MALNALLFVILLMSLWSLQVVSNLNQGQGVGHMPSHHGSASAYVTFAHREDARACIHSVDGFVLEGRPLKANFGKRTASLRLYFYKLCTKSELYCFCLPDKGASFLLSVAYHLRR